MLKSLNTTKLVSVAILSAVLFGCGTTTPVTQPSETLSLVSASMASSQYLAKAANTKDAENKDKYLLLAAHAYLNEGNPEAAGQLLASFKSSITPKPELLAEHKYLTARVQEQISTFDEALATVVYPSSWRLPEWQMAAYHQLRARLYKQTNQPIEQARELSLLSKYLPAAQTGEVNNTIWRTLSAIPEDTLSNFSRDSADSIFTGWVQLAFIAKHYGVDPSQLIRYLGDWQAQNPFHPAAAKLPADLERALNAKPYKPQNIAVLLPLTGPRAAVVDAVRQGIMSSYLADPSSQISLKFYDTANDVTGAYRQAVGAGAEFIIGPLLQDEITKLQALGSADASSTALTSPTNGENSDPVANAVSPVSAPAAVIPQLFLNQADKFTPDIDKFYFALSPQQEANDAASRMFKDGIRMPLLLVSNDAIGRRMADSFNQSWQQLTGKNAEVHYYDAGDKMKITVQEALGVTDSKNRIARIKELLGSKVQADFRSRSDIDAIYMVSGAQDIALLKPFIDVNFSVFAEPVPLYASSRSRINEDTQNASQDFNNLTISDVPWLMQATPENRVVRELWPNWNNSQKRLYVMGYDALQLVGRLAQMRAFPGYQFDGRSGELSVSPDGIINRQLSWGKYQRGSLRPL